MRRYSGDSGSNVFLQVFELFEISIIFSTKIFIEILILKRCNDSNYTGIEFAYSYQFIRQPNIIPVERFDEAAILSSTFRHYDK